MDKEHMAHLHQLSAELYQELHGMIESKKQEAYQDNSPDGVVKQYFWRYIRSSLYHTAREPHFLTYLHHAYCGSNPVGDPDISTESKHVLDDVLLPAPKNINKGLQDGKSYWDYSDPCNESDDILNWMP